MYVMVRTVFELSSLVMSIFRKYTAGILTVLLRKTEYILILSVSIHLVDVGDQVTTVRLVEHESAHLRLLSLSTFLCCLQAMTTAFSKTFFVSPFDLELSTSTGDTDCFTLFNYLQQLSLRAHST